MKDLEDIIKEVGGDSTFQKRLLYVVLSPLFFLLPLSWMSEIFFLSIPDHWCYHPMTQYLNATELNAWKKCFLIQKKIRQKYFPKNYFHKKYSWKILKTSIFLKNGRGKAPLLPAGPRLISCDSEISVDFISPLPWKMVLPCEWNILLVGGRTALHSLYDAQGSPPCMPFCW